MNERVISRDTFIGAFVTRHKFAVKHCVYLDVVIFGQNGLHTLEHNFSRIFEELARFDMFEIYYRASQYAAFKRCNFTPS